MRYYLLNVFMARIALAVLADLIFFAGAATAVWLLSDPPFAPQAYAAAAAGGAAASFGLLYYCDAYGLQVLGSGRRTLSCVTGAMGVAAAIGLGVHFLVDLPARTLDTGARVAAIYFPLLLAGRLGFRLVSSQLTRRVLIVGVSDLSLAIARSVRDRRNLGIEIAGYLSDEPDDQGAWLEGYPVLGRIHEIEKIVPAEQISRIVVASKKRDEYFPADELLDAKLRGVRVESGVSFYERVTGRIYLRDLHPGYLIFSSGFRADSPGLAAKRALDLCVGSLALLLFSPILGLAALAVRLDSPGPVFFTQERVGRGGRRYRVWKLRSMRDDAESQTGPVFTQADDDRVTRVGRVLRKARLDELPQLWNVVRGDMSLVGPRPERPEFVDQLSAQYPYFRFRSTFKPGITGWAQIRHGYVNSMSEFEEKLSLDLYYMKYWSFGMDLLILIKTLKTVILLRGV